MFFNFKVIKKELNGSINSVFEGRMVGKKEDDLEKVI